MIEIGAGGGSIATIDEVGLLEVGPRSAGADPGPACYGRDETAPTVTDANLVLDHYDPGFFLGGAMPLDRDEHVGAPLADCHRLRHVRAPDLVHPLGHDRPVMRMRRPRRLPMRRQQAVRLHDPSHPARAVRTPRKRGRAQTLR